MKEAAIRIGLVGAGGYGEVHRRALGRLQSRGDARLVAVADPTVERQSGLRQSLEKEQVRIYSGLAGMLADEDGLDAIVIAAPIPYHCEIALECLKRDLPVYLEKPPVPTLDQLEQLIAADVHRRFFVGFQQIVSLWMLQLGKWQQEGRFGELESIRVGGGWPRPDSYYQRAGWAGKMKFQGRPVFDGPATNALSHLIHSACKLASGSATAFALPRTVRADLYRARPIESYDTAFLSADFENGVAFSAALTHSTREPHPFELKIDGTRGWAHLSQDGRLLDSPWGTFDYPVDVDSAMDRSYESFLAFVCGRETRMTSLEDTRGYLLMTETMFRSSGGIHSISPEWIEEIRIGQDRNYAVRGLSEVVCQSLATGAHPADQGLPWSVRTSAVFPDRGCPIPT